MSTTLTVLPSASKHRLDCCRILHPLCKKRGEIFLKSTFLLPGARQNIGGTPTRYHYTPTPVHCSTTKMRFEQRALIPASWTPHMGRLPLTSSVTSPSRSTSSTVVAPLIALAS